MKKRKIILPILLLLLGTAVYFAYQIFGGVISEPKEKYFYIPTGTTFEEVKKTLTEKNILKSNFYFDAIAKQLKYVNNVKAGRYKIDAGTSIYSLVKMLRSGNQYPVNLVINKLRTREDVAEKIAANFECDSLSVINFLNNNDSLKKYSLDTNTVLTAIIPNTYNINWNTSPSKIFKKLYADYETFWTTDRKNKAAALNMNEQQVYTMASIVEEETNKEDDKGKIASVYFNRIATGNKLEADPTVKYAMKNFGLKRILKVHLQYPSLYNTYQHTGLPPGPICTPSSKTIDAVLNMPKTNYLFFVAKPDFKGYSNFAATYPEHLVFAHAYQNALDSMIRSKALQQK
jgi:UPF0755 protein